MAKAIGWGDVCPDVTTHKMRWRIERNGHTKDVFCSLDEMEFQLEHLLEDRCRLNPTLERDMLPSLKRRREAIRQRRIQRTNGGPMMFQSRINGM